MAVKVQGGTINGFVDTNSNELLKTTATASAVNEFTIVNAATGNAPDLQATGGDTNIDAKITPKGTGQLAMTGNDLNCGGGYRQTFDLFFQDNVAISQSAVILARNAAPAFGDKLVLPRAGSITAVCVKSNAARTAGTLTVEVFKAAAGTGLTAVLDGTNTTYKATTQAKDTDTFAAGDELDVRITTDGTWAPTTADIRVSV